MKKTICMLLVALLMLLCGTALAANDEVHRCYSFSYAYDDEYHWEVCDHCGTVKGEKWSHTNSCTNIGTCANCGVTGLTNEITHQWGNGWQYNEKDCWLVCKNCGFEEEHRAHYFLCGDELPAKCQRCKQPCEITHLWGERLDYTPGNCIEGGVSVMKCSTCGIVETVVEESTGDCWYDWCYDDADHWLACTGCGKMDGNPKNKHRLSCVNIGTCRDCGATGVTGEVLHFWDWAHDDQLHWDECNECGAIERKGRHVLSCVEIGTCEYCGATGVSGEVDHYWTGAWAGDEQFCWNICGDCGAESEHTPHVSRCNQRNPGFCMNCGLPCEIGHVYWDTVSLIRGNCVTSTIEKRRCRDCGEEQTVEWEFTGKCWYDYVNEGDVHTFMCTGCNTIRYSEGHSRSCMGGTSCLFCGAEGITGGISHEEYELVNQGDTHAYVCTACGAIDWSEEHSVPCTGGTTCVDCGAEGVTGEFSHEAADGWHYDNEKCWLNCANCDAHAFENPHWNFCNAMEACINCGATDVTLMASHNTSETSAMGYGLTSCWYLCDTCGEACYHMPHLFEEGGACSVCGFAGIATVPVEATVEGENLSADVTLLVEQPQEDVSALLPEDIRASVQQVYLVKLLEKGETIEPNGSIRITIQLEEGAELTGKKLMRLQEDDTLAEIAYEVVEGKLTFVTKAVGTFVLVDATAE